MKSSAAQSAVPQVRRKEEPEYEKKIKIIQNREGGRVDVRIREQYILDVIKQFQYLIQRIARHTWQVYGKPVGQSHAEWHHETLTVFCELLISDYTPIEYGGAATFGPYIKTKLFCQMRWHGQKQQRHDSRHTNIDFSLIEMWDFEPGQSEGNSKIYTELRESIYQNVTDASEEVMQEVDDDAIVQKLGRICRIAQAVLDEDTLFVWNKYFFSEMTIADIGVFLKMSPNTANAKIRRMLKDARRLIFEELGRQSIQDALKK